ncbi:TolC family outer membrane protein [Hydrocarboniphaga sp.]|uniref:TolC family outer membrane protein n=1 Tax=Hydrocarboniphaga sp. TaxID=2033016 RepID=UPI0026090160|nr:TolC family outer membrane protein [Hydrocarboniphaga sp.]
MIRRVLGAAGVAAVCVCGNAGAMSLSEAYDAARTHDPTAAVFEAQFESDREAGIIERATIRPTVDLQGTGTYADTRSKGVFGSAQDDYPTWGATAKLRQPLFRLDWFAIGDRADALESQAELTLRSARLDLQRRVAERYFNVLIAQSQLDQAEAEAQAVDQSLEDTRKRYEVELVPGTDLKEAQARQDLAQAQRVTARRNLENARDELQETTGNGAAALPALPAQVTFPALMPATAEEWVAAARAASPRIASAQVAAEIARTRSETTRAQAYPTLDLVGSAGRDDTSHYAFGSRTDDARIGVELNIPIYAGGATRAGLRQAAAQQRAAAADFERIQRETERETRQLFRSVETAYIENRAYEKSVTSAEAAQAATRNGYDAGTRTITDVLNAQSQLVQARLDLSTTRYNLLLNLLQLKQTVGRLSERDFAEIDALLLAPQAQQNNDLKN